MSSLVEIVLMAMLALMMVVCYLLLVVASRAEERAERMCRKWIETNRELVDALKADTICAQNLKTSKWKESKGADDGNK